MSYQDNNFDIVYERYADMLYRLSLSYLNNTQDAEDVLQDVFIRYLKKPMTFQNEEHRRAWFVRVTINRSHDILRSRKNYLSLDEVSAVSPQEMPLTLFDQLAVLPEKNKTVIILHYLEGYSVEEVASMLHLSVSAVKMRLMRAKKILRKKMGKENEHV